MEKLKYREGMQLAQGRTVRRPRKLRWHSRPELLAARQLFL